MKSFKNFFLISAVILGLGLTACNNDDIDGVQNLGKGNTFVSVTMKLSSNNGAGTRVTNDEEYNYVGKWAGRDDIKSLTVYLVDGASVNAKTFEVGTGKAYEINTDGILIPKTNDAAIRTTAGSKTVYVVVNPTAEITALLNKTSVAEFDRAYQEIPFVAGNSGTGEDKLQASTSASKLAKVEADKDAIVMTNVAPGSITVAENITAEQTIGAAVGDALKNRISVEVERVVARVMTTTATTNYTIPTTGGSSSLGVISNISWVLAQGENSLYVQRKSTWETPNYAWEPTDQAAFQTQAGDKYDYSGLYESYEETTGFGGTTVPGLTAYKALGQSGVSQADVLASLGLDANAVNGKFVLPTTHEYGAKDASKYKKGNTAYVLVRAKFTPANDAWGDDGIRNADGTFYVGANGKFYTTAQAAYNDTQSKVITKYEGGKVLYYAWVNPDEVPEWYNSPVLRNNIYHIHITGFKNLGTNWNPLFPEDPDRVLTDPTKPYDPIDNPYLPKDNPDPKPIPETVVDPGNPGVEIPIEEPGNPIDPTDPLTTPETWMSVDVTVLPWLVHSYQVELGI